MPYQVYLDGYLNGQLAGLSDSTAQEDVRSEANRILNHLYMPRRIGWALNTTTEMSRYIEGSMDYAPRRKEILTTLELTREDTHTYGEFVCKSNGFLTVELACSPKSPSCFVGFWQDQRACPPRGKFA